MLSGLYARSFFRLQYMPLLIPISAPPISFSLLHIQLSLHILCVHIRLFITSEILFPYINSLENFFLFQTHLQDRFYWLWISNDPLRFIAFNLNLFSQFRIFVVAKKQSEQMEMISQYFFFALRDIELFGTMSTTACQDYQPITYFFFALSFLRYLLNVQFLTRIEFDYYQQQLLQQSLILTTVLSERISERQIDCLVFLFLVTLCIFSHLHVR